MTANKDFKRIVRARARRNGESYSSALRHLTSPRRGRTTAAASARGDQEREPMTIVRAIPDIRSTDVDRSRHFYCEVLGFRVCMEQGDMLMFCSPSHSWVQVMLNGDGVSLPPGFAVDVDEAQSVQRLHELAADRGDRIIEPIGDKAWGIRRFSVLDPSGTRVTLFAHLEPTPPNDLENHDAPVQIVRAIPTVRARDRQQTREFYVDYLGFDVCMDMDPMVMFCSPSHPRVQVVTTVALSQPPGFDLDVGNVERLEELHERVVHEGYTVISPPADVADAVRSFTVVDPNGTAVAVLAHLDVRHQTPAG